MAHPPLDVSTIFAGRLSHAHTTGTIQAGLAQAILL
jgi:hypothetical protein